MLTKFRSVILFVTAMAVCLPLSAQIFSSSIRKADKEYELQAFNRAIESYREYLDKKPTDGMAMGKLADCYRHLNQMEQAAQWYDKALQQDKFDPVIYLQYGHVLKALKRYDDARYRYQQYAREDPVLSDHFVKSCDRAKFLTGTPSEYQVVMEVINTPNSEFGPAFFGDEVVFSSARMDIPRPGATGRQPANQLYAASVGANGFLGSIRFLRRELQSNFSEGPVSFSPDLRRVAYTRNNFVDGTRPIPTSGMALSLYLADVTTTGDWINDVPFPYNGSGYSTGFPCFSPDGNALYFASDRPGGFGGYDIYVCYRMGSTWSTPENLGPDVNSMGNEITPFFDGNRLFFSSDFHDGLGGYDVFMARQTSSGFSPPISNLGIGVNSSRDDYGFVYNSFRNIGYMVSNRPGGKGNDDLYKVSKSAENIVLRVTSASDGRPVAGATVDFSACGERVFQTDNQGIYSFQVVDELNCEVVVSASGFRSQSFQITAPGLRQNQEYNIGLSRLGEEYYGNVIDYTTSQPVSEVLITATNQNTGGIQETRTDQTGNYALALSADAVFIVRYSRSGYRDVNRTVKLQDVSNRTMLGTISMMPSSFNPGGLEPAGPAGTVGIKTPEAQPSAIASGYAVQVAALSRPNLEQFIRLESLGTVYAKEENGIYKIRIGVFNTRREAESALQGAKRQGYSRAFITEEAGGSVQGAEIQPDSGFSEATTGSLGRYMVQLGAYSNPRYFDGSVVGNYGVIEDRQRGNLTIKLLAGYDTLDEARRALAQARSAGFPDAYIVVEENGALRKVN